MKLSPVSSTVHLLWLPFVRWNIRVFHEFARRLVFSISNEPDVYETLIEFSKLIDRLNSNRFIVRLKTKLVKEIDSPEEVDNFVTICILSARSDIAATWGTICAKKTRKMRESENIDWWMISLVWCHILILFLSLSIVRNLFGFSRLVFYFVLSFSLTFYSTKKRNVRFLSIENGNHIELFDGKTVEQRKFRRSREFTCAKTGWFMMNWLFL